MNNEEFQYGGDVEFGIYDLQDIHTMASKLSEAHSVMTRFYEILDEMHVIQLKMDQPIYHPEINIEAMKKEAYNLHMLIEKSYEVLQNEYRKRVRELMKLEITEVINGARDLLQIIDLE